MEEIQQKFFQEVIANHVSSVKKILKKHPTFANIKDNDGETALIVVSRNGNISCLNNLIEAGADPNIQDHIGWTALMWASRYGHLPCVEALLEAGAQPNIYEYGWTALMLASERGRVSCVEALLKAGAQPDIQSDGGWTALMKASSRGNLSIVEALLKAGAQPNIKDHKGKTAYMLTDNQNIKHILKKYENIWSLMPMYIASYKNKLGLPIELVNKISKML